MGPPPAGLPCEALSLQIQMGLHMNMQRIVRGLIAVPLACCMAAALLPRTTLAGDLSEQPDRPPMSVVLPDLEGRLRSLDEFAGKVVLVNFWASWCTPCVLEMPSILRLKQALPIRSFAVVGVNVAEGERRARAAARRLDLDFTILVDRDGEVFAGLGGRVLPTTYLLDHGGRIRYAAVGPLEWDDEEVIETVRRLIRESPRPALAAD
jgi:thiol-disulfide isomerase/thioredoxin